MIEHRLGKESFPKCDVSVGCPHGKRGCPGYPVGFPNCLSGRVFIADCPGFRFSSSLKRLVQQVALDANDAHYFQNCQFGLCLDAFGDELVGRFVAETDHSASAYGTDS